MATDIKITGKQLRYLRSLAHALNPTVQLGKNGYTDAIVAQLDQSLTDHELIKVKLSTDCPTTVDELTTGAQASVAAQLIQIVGNTVVLYRRHPEKPKISLPSRTRK